MRDFPLFQANNLSLCELKDQSRDIVDLKIS